MADDLERGEAPVSLNEARSWLRLGATIDDAVIAGLIRAATNICEAYIGQWLIRRAGEEILPLKGGAAQIATRPIVGVEAVTLIAADGEVPLSEADYRVDIARDGTGQVTVHAAGAARQARVAYRAGIARGANGVPEAIRQGILRMTQHLHDARDGAEATPPTAIAALWQPWRRLTLGGGR